MQNAERKIIETIAGNFYNGIRDDFIDTNKILRLCSADKNISLDLIAEVIHKKGIEFGGRFYFVTENISSGVKCFIDKILKKFSIVYYSAVHKKHPEVFLPLKIFSPELLKKFLWKSDTDHFYFSEFCAADGWTRPEYEISKIFAAKKKPLTLKDLQSMLPYIPTEKISAVLSDTKKYLETREGSFVAVSEIQFARDEILAAKRKIFACIKKNGFATPDDFTLAENFALNPELDEKILRNIISEKFFFDDFTIRKNKFFKKNAAADKADAKDLLKNFIAAKNELTVERLFAEAETFELSQSAAISLANEKMIRAEKNLFVKDALINFDVAAVDEALTSFVQGKIIPLRAVTSFTGFPSVAGCSWNLFLLESFLRKHSRRYVYASPAVNNSNLGAIHSKSLEFDDYLDVQAAAVAQEKIPLEKSAVENFLIDSGFRARRFDKITEQIIVRAQEILTR